jgi:hypothetical protein
MLEKRKIQKQIQLQRKNKKNIKINHLFNGLILGHRVNKFYKLNKKRTNILLNNGLDIYKINIKYQNLYMVD